MTGSESYSAHVQLQVSSLAWPDPFSRRALSIRDDKRPREKGLE